MTAEIENSKTDIAVGAARIEGARLPSRETVVDIGCRAFLVVIFILYGAPNFIHAAKLLREMRETGIDLPALAEVLSVLSVGLWMLLIVYLAIIRLRPVEKSSGLAPRLAAFFGTAIPMFTWIFPLNDHIGVAGKLASTLLILVGATLSFYVLRQLGRSFSVMPEARRLVTRGPYALVRHPLYWAEFICFLGVQIRYWSLGVAVILCVQVAFQLLRMRYEERVLLKAFPEYAAYSRRTARLVPGLY